MENLSQITAINSKIKTAPVRAIKALHIFIFEHEGDRSNRKRLRSFDGFKFHDGSAEHTAKLKYAGEHLVEGDLISICNILNLDYSGLKEDLMKRICASLMDLNVLNNDDETSEDEDEAEDENDLDETVVRGRDNGVPGIDNGREREIRQQQIFPLSYRDIENTIRPFDGSDAYPVERWITDFEDAAVLFNWSALQQLVFAKRALTGLAKLFIQGERSLKTWRELKTALRMEFAKTTNSAQLHEALSRRKMKKEESVHEYFLIMKELASRGCVEKDALIKYVIDGIRDDENNKVILYGARGLQDFKERLRLYEEIRQKGAERATRQSRIGTESTGRSTSFRQNAAPKRKEVPATVSSDKCFNCGDSGHRSKYCKFKSLGTKCFKCQKHGHIAANCNEQRGSKTSGMTSNDSVNSVNMVRTDKVYKVVSIENVRMSALLDTGSEVSIMREDVYKQIGAPTLQNSCIPLIGIGQHKVMTLGHFQACLQIDDEEFELKMHIVSNQTMSIPIVIGNDILKESEVKIGRDGITITKVSQTVFLAQINVEPNSNVDVTHIADKNIRAEVENLVMSYTPVKTKTTDIEMSIVVKEERPIYQRPRRLPVPEKEIVEAQIVEWLKDEVVEVCSSEYASPVLVVRKKDGTPRICIDYRKVNQVIMKDRYPLPLIDDQLDKLRDARIFNTIDLKNGFFHVNVDRNSRKYTAFVTHSGQYQFRKVPFGLCNSPSVFQRFINCVFRELINDGIVLPYLDDLIIPARDQNEALVRLKAVFQTASEYGLNINFKKCQFMRKSVEFLGHVIEENKVFPSPDKTAAVARFPLLKSLKDVQSFLGLTGYFRKFIPQYSLIAKPLSDLLRKDSKFKFDNEERNAFEQLKGILAERPVLKIYRMEDETELHTDASKDGYGAMLLQRDPEDGQMHPVYYMSHKTSPAERNYSSYELEVLAVIGALRKFRIYLLGIKFTIVTDCAAFQMTMNKKELASRIARWALLIEEFDYTVVHRPATRMKHVDALSRYPVMLVTDGVPRIKKAQEEDGETKAIMEILQSRRYEDYCIRNGMLYNFKDGKYLLVIPRAMQNEVIRNAHEDGHFATKRTEEKIKQDYFIPDLKRKIERHISNCIHCIIGNKKSGKQEGFLHPIEKDSTPLYTYHVDHLGPLESTSKQYNHILAVIDGFTKFVWLYPTKSTTTREVLSKLEQQKHIFGNPTQIISDRGTAFTSNEFRDYCTEEGIRHACITTGLPRANGQVERLNRTIIPILTKLSMDDPTKWYRHVNRLQQVLNSSFHRSINKTPFELMFGTKMRNKSDLELRNLIEREIQGQFEISRDDIRKTAKEQIQKVQQENCKTYNLRRRVPAKYRVGDLVAIKRTQLGPGIKVKAKYLGPYKIKRVKANDTYDVERVGGHEGPLSSSTCAEYLKAWVMNESLSEADNE